VNQEHDLRAELLERVEFFGGLTSLGIPRRPKGDSAQTVAGVEAAAAGSAGTLDEIRATLGDCQRCQLAGTRKSIVFGQGHPRARLMFVGEAPGADEDEQGLAFVGKAGQLLTRIIEAIGMTRGRLHRERDQVSAAPEPQP
jgi:hypothetical protein